MDISGTIVALGGAAVVQVHVLSFLMIVSLFWLHKNMCWSFSFSTESYRMRSGDHESVAMFNGVLFCRKGGLGRGRHLF